MIKFKEKGNFNTTEKYLKKLPQKLKIEDLDSYGKKGVLALSKATPVDSGLTASSWDYFISRKDDKVSLVFTNSNVNNGVPIAIILQYGHATGWGGYVQGRDYINPAVRPIFDEILNKVWKEVTKTT